jgi:EAL and modified HD-GYP domain-containing signal transduction protein
MTDPHDPHRVRDFYLARQPILNRDQGLFGYELLFRNAPAGPAQFDSELSATASVISHAAHLGLEKVIGDGLGFVNVDAEVLMSDIFSFLPRDKVVLEIVETTKATPVIVHRVRELAAYGFKFALDDVVTDSDDVTRLLPMVEYVKLDLRGMPLSALLKLAPRLKADKKKLLAEKVESVDEFKLCLDLGFDFFQGYYFARPVVMSGKKLSPSQLSVMELMTLITSEADNAAVEAAVKRDVTLALNLLRLVNTPGVGARRQIDSLSQALTVLGRRQLQRWLQIMLYAEPARRAQGMSPLLLLATTRGRMLELLAQRLRPSDRNAAEVAFTIGIMSLMDTLFGMPMQDILAQIPVVDEVAHALLFRKGFLGQLLQLVECIERIDEMEHLLVPTLRQLAISAEELLSLELSAYEWSNLVARSAS